MTDRLRCPKCGEWGRLLILRTETWTATQMCRVCYGFDVVWKFQRPEGISAERWKTAP